MNPTAALTSERHVRGKFPQVFAVVAGITLIASLGLAARTDISTDNGRPFLVPAASGESLATDISTYQAGERAGLVPDEFGGGYRAPRNLRERLQGERGEFSASFR